MLKHKPKYLTKGDILKEFNQRTFLKSFDKHKIARLKILTA